MLFGDQCYFRRVLFCRHSYSRWEEFHESLVPMFSFTVKVMVLCRGSVKLNERDLKFGYIHQFAVWRCGYILIHQFTDTTDPIRCQYAIFESRMLGVVFQMTVTSVPDTEII